MYTKLPDSPGGVPVQEPLTPLMNGPVLTNRQRHGSDSPGRSGSCLVQFLDLE
jgi:hypothetical protein